MITPQHFEILQPLKDFRILSTDDLKQLSQYEKSKSAFYKIVSRLEKNEFLKSFDNPWTKEKYLYLTTQALKKLGEERDVLPVNLDQRFHDAIVTKVALSLKSFSRFDEVYLDSNISRAFPLLERTPDILAIGSRPKEMRLAIEVELTQKNKSRLLEIFRTYDESKVINNVIYITDKKSIFKSYQEIPNSSRFIFIYEKNLRLKSMDILNSPAIFNKKETTLGSLLQV